LALIADRFEVDDIPPTSNNAEFDATLHATTE